MSYFKHSQTNKYLTFSDIAPTFSGEAVELSSCTKCETDLEPAAWMDSNANSYHIKKINKNGASQCITLGGKDNVLGIGACDENSRFEIMVKKEGDDDKITPRDLDFFIVFDDNNTVNINGNKTPKKMSLTNGAHTYLKNARNVKHIFKLRNPVLSKDGKRVELTTTNMNTENVEIRANMFLIIEEYDNKNYADVPRKTVYKMVYVNDVKKIGNLRKNNKVNSVILFEKTTSDTMDSSSSDSAPIVIKYLERKFYPHQNDKKPVNSQNFYKAVIGIDGKDGKFLNGKIDTNIYSGGIILGGLATEFRIIPVNTLSRHEIIYSNVDDKRTLVNLSSGMNPAKKIVISKDGQLVSKNLKDGVLNKSTTFKIEPVSENFQGYEGFATIRSLIDEVKKLSNMLKSGSSTAPKEIDSQCQIILKMIKVAESGNAVAHSKNIKKIVEYISFVATRAEELISILKEIKSKYLKMLTNIPIDNLRGPKLKKDAFFASFDVNGMSRLNRELEKYAKIVDIYNNKIKELNKSGFELSLNQLELDPRVISNINNIFIHFKKDNTRINNAINTFYDFLEINKSNYYEFPTYRNNKFINPVTSKTSYNGPSTTDVKALIKAGEKMSNLKMGFFDIDFGDIYELLFRDAGAMVNDARMNSLISKNVTVDKLIGGGILHYYYNFMTSQKYYVIQHNTLIDIKQKLSQVLNIQDNNPKMVVTNIAKKLSDVASFIQTKYDGAFNWRSDFYNIVDYYAGAMNTNDTPQDHIYYFSYCYSNVVNNINMEGGYTFLTLDHYYSISALLMKYEKNIIDGFINKYSEMYNQAKSMLDGNGDEYFAMNQQRKKIIEGFANNYSVDASGSASMFPITPSIISNYSQNILTDAFRYEKKNEGGYGVLEEYLKDKYADYIPNQYTCVSDKKDIVFSANYKCGTTPRTITDAAIGQIIDGSVSFGCNVNNCAVNSKLELEHDDSVGVVLKLTDSGSTTIKLCDVISNYNDCSQFTTVGTTPKTEILTNTSTMDYLEKLLSGEKDSVTLDSPTKALYDDDKKLRLIIDSDGLLKVQYIPPISLSIDSNNHYATDLSNVVLYSNDISLGVAINKRIYIDPTGQAHSLDDSNSNVSHSETYDSYCLDETKGEGSIDLLNVPADESKLEYVYPKPSSSDCVTGDTSVTIELPKKSFSLDYRECPTSSEHGVELVNSATMNALLLETSTEWSDTTSCGIKHIMSGAVANLETSRSAFQTTFNDMITMFNELSESELKMLKQTDEDIHSLNSIIDEYKELHDKVISNSARSNILAAQTVDASISLRNADYKLALTGIGAIGAAIIAFNYMKK